MPHTSGERYAVVSCHVERPLDDVTWSAYARLAAARPGGLAVAALLRPPDEAAGERWEPFLERARQAAAWGPVGHHTHWTSPSHARPVPGADGDPGATVRGQGAALLEHGIRPTLFCGGGWYTDAGVAAACADLGYVDLTPRPLAPPYLAPDAPWACLDAPAVVAVPGTPPLRAIPTTHTIGDALRAALRPGGLPRLVHVYFHDTDLLDARRRRALHVALRLLGRRCRVASLADADALLAGAPGVSWAAVARPLPGPEGE